MADYSVGTYLSGNYGSIVSDKQLGIWYKIVSITGDSITIDAEIWLRDTTANMSDSNNTLYFSQHATSATDILASNIDVKITQEQTLIYTKRLGTYQRNNVSYNCSAKWVGVGGADITISVTNSFTVPNLESYTVSYNINGGTGSMASQIKYYGVPLTLANGKIKRQGYTFLEWNTKSDGSGTSYSSGGIYNENEAVTLYAQWQKNTYRFDYNANGGYGNMKRQSWQWQDTHYLSDNNFKREGYKFVGWNVCRDDNKWYVDNQSWLSEDEIIVSEYEKKVFENREKITFDELWISGNEDARTFTMYAIWEISGVVYIDNGDIFEPYLAYVDNGTDWELYLMYVDDGTKWDIIS